MKLRTYIIDKKFFLLFYIILMIFISAVIYLDHTVKVSTYNILYINFVLFIFLLFYILGGYLFHKRYYTNIYELIKTNKENSIHCLPEPNTYQQGLYHQLLQNAYETQSREIEKLHEEKRENLEFIASWVHEIKTPISVTRLILENSLGKPISETLDSLEEEVDKIDNYVERALYYSKIDAFSKDYFITEINLDKLIKEMVKKHAKTFINKKIKIEIENLNTFISSDTKWLSFIVEQILSNSLKYTSTYGKIKIYFEEDSKEKKLIIEDNGIGIKQEDIGRIFDKGFTGYIGRQNYKSTGMGLYLAKKLSKKLGHDITAISEFEEYTKVIIHFPKLIDYFNVSKL